MITIFTLFIIWGFISYLRIKRICNQKEEEFNPFEGSFIDYLGFLTGAAISIISIVTFSVRYLP
jgi:hypothetical protein